MNDHTSSKMPLVMIGAGGHARVLCALARLAGYEILGVCDPRLTLQGELSWRGLPVLGGDDALNDIDPTKVGVINGIGQLVANRLRESVYNKIKKLGFSFPLLIHPTAWVDETVILQNGVQIMAGVVIQPGCEIGENTIINTNASIDHDCKIGAHVHVAPGATLCGAVSLGDNAFIGAGSTVIQKVTISAGAIVGAGSVLTRNLPSGIAVRPALQRFS